MGISVGKVFKPIESELAKYENIYSIELPIANYSIKGLLTNISFMRKYLKGKYFDAVLITNTPLKFKLPQPQIQISH